MTLFMSVKTAWVFFFNSSVLLIPESHYKPYSKQLTTVLHPKCYHLEIPSTNLINLLLMYYYNLIVLLLLNSVSLRFSEHEKNETESLSECDINIMWSSSQ